MPAGRTVKQTARRWRTESLEENITELLTAAIPVRSRLNLQKFSGLAFWLANLHVVMSQQFSLRFNDSQSLPATPCDMNATWNTSFAAASGGLPTHVFKLSGAPSCYLGRNRRHVRSCRFECLCIAVRLPIRFLLLLRRSLAFDLSLFGLSLFGHVIASPDLLDLW